MLQKGWLLPWCRSSIDLLQDLALSKKPSSPFSSPSKSNLGPTANTEQTPKKHKRKENEGMSARQHGRQSKEVGGEGRGRSRGGDLSQKLSQSCMMKLSIRVQSGSAGPNTLKAKKNAIARHVFRCQSRFDFFFSLFTLQVQSASGSLPSSKVLT